MRKIIFLDIDGVMNSVNERKLHPEDFGKMYGIDPKPVAILNDLVKKTGAEIVLSSTWRLDDDYKEVMAKAGINVIDRTPYLVGEIRGEEIDQWLEEKGKDVDVYAIIDDDSDMLPFQPHFKTSGFEWGLTQEIADRIYLHLGAKEKKPKINHLLAFWHLLFGHPIEDCKPDGVLTKRCKCGVQICLADFYGW